MARQLKTIARFINEHVVGLSASSVPSGPKMPGCRDRTGKRPSGVLLLVWVTDLVGDEPAPGDLGVVLAHDTSYQDVSNDRAEAWLEAWLRRWPQNYWCAGRWWSRSQVIWGEPWA